MALCTYGGQYARSVPSLSQIDGSLRGPCSPHSLLTVQPSPSTSFPTSSISPVISSHTRSVTPTYHPNVSGNGCQPLAVTCRPRAADLGTRLSRLTEQTPLSQSPQKEDISCSRSRCPLVRELPTIPPIPKSFGAEESLLSQWFASNFRVPRHLPMLSEAVFWS